MNLQAQIELITVPQEFTRLCNAVLRAENGADFLPIDDDRSDRGNDGYLKSEQRMFAIHCFKRPQKRLIDAEIQTKMLGDLRKAIALAQSGDWAIRAWTFLSNYPIPERLGAQAVQMGRSGGIDVSWRGPDYLAEVLQRHRPARELFPSLLTNDVLDRLDRINSRIDGHARPQESLGVFHAVPTTEAETQVLIAQAPAGWEYLLFAGALVQGKLRLEPKWRDYVLGYARPNGCHVQELDVEHDLRGRLTELMHVSQNIMLILAREAQERAFGAPGVAGDPDAIIHLAERLVSCYESLLDWAAEIRGAVYPDAMKHAAHLAASVVRQPAEDIRTSFDQMATMMGEVPDALATGRQVELALCLTLTVDDGVIADFNRQFRRG
ncbi:hypothetical protein [Embleya sp. NPDC005971]|uniref:hypothetical protein n=1 Tax=Embleya sp. NPDC005971 TaxID=3156724 RepID=UPI0033D57F15